MLLQKLQSTKLKVMANHIIVYDFETVGRNEKQAKDSWTCIPVSLAAKAFHGQSFEPIDNGEFYTLIEPDIPIEEVHDSCFAFLHMSRDDFKDAPPQKQVWREFQEYCSHFNKEKNKWTAPIAAGQNIKGFDNNITLRLNNLYLPKTGPKSHVFQDTSYNCIDLMDLTWFWFNHILKTPKLPNRKLSTILDFCRIPYDPTKLHNAQYDVAKTGEVIMKFLKWHRSLYEAHAHHFGVR